MADLSNALLGQGAPLLEPNEYERIRDIGLRAISSRIQQCESLIIASIRWRAEEVCGYLPDDVQ